MASGCKIVSANVSAEPSCKHATSSSQNSLPGCYSFAASSEKNSCQAAAFFLVSCTVFAHSIFMMPKQQGRSEVPIIFPLLPQS